MPEAVPMVRPILHPADVTFYENASKGSWEVIAKGFRLGNEEALAGEHAEHLLYIIDEASGVSDKAFGIIKVR